ncbi:hypothetical protein G7084_00445 [Weissella coleopterorum]|uniref:Uncharacterized protein n=1 Tax=Weissella coleopterorum TaxID=2714949 RepID=A0A6G8AY44_9LACO|nr:hypothetical protein [Weissella coleopterorum]QIL49927.1 hypothetical protein G7084_00445 [Weissella coleopterorum]
MSKLKYIGLAVVILTTAFFVSISTGNIHADDRLNTNNNVQLKPKDLGKSTDLNKKSVKDTDTDTKKTLNKDLQKSDSGISKEDMQAFLKNHSIDKIQSNDLIGNFKPYYTQPGMTDISSKIARSLADMFSAFNRDIVYSMFDVMIGRLFDMTSIQTSVDGVMKESSGFTINIWNNKAFMSLLYTAFAVGIVMAFVSSLKSGGGIRSLATIFILVIIGGAWINAGGEVLSKVNDITTQMEVMAFDATKNDEKASSVNNFQQQIRFQFFEQAVERPFYLENFNTISDDGLDTKKMGDPYDFMIGKDDIPGDNPIMSKDGKKAWYQSMVALVSIFTSIAYGIPLLVIGLMNLALQLAAILLYMLAPVAFIASMIPKFASSATKVIGGSILMLIGKVLLIFLIVILNMIQAFVDGLIPPTNTGKVASNGLIYILLMWLFWKRKGDILSAITGSRMASSMADKFGVQKGFKKVKDSAEKSVQKGKNGVNKGKELYNKGKETTQKVQQKRKDNRYRKAGVDPEEVRKDEEMRKSVRQEQEQTQRRERVKKEMAGTGESQAFNRSRNARNQNLGQNNQTRPNVNNKGVQNKYGRHNADMNVNDLVELSKKRQQVRSDSLNKVMDNERR